MTIPPNTVILTEKGLIAVKPDTTSKDTMSENDKTVWNFYPTEPIASISHIPLQEDTAFSPEYFCFLFHGYKTGYSLNATLWGQKTGLDITIAPHNVPRETQPGESTEIDTDAALPEAERQRIRELCAKRDELKTKLPPPMDEATEEKYWEHIDSQRFTDAFKKALAIWNDPMTSRPTKCRQVGEPLVELYKTLHPVQLPDELMRDDSQFAVLLAKITQFTRAVEENAGKNSIDLPSEVNALTRLTDELTDKMIEGGNKLYGIPRDMTQEEHNAYTDIKLVALYSEKPAKERLELLETLWDYALADLDDRIHFLDTAIDLIRGQAIHCPDEALINRHLRTIGEQLARLETEGETTWKNRLAKTQAAKTAGEPAPSLYLQDISADTQEKENGETHCTLTLRFIDEDRSKNNPPVYAIFENGVLTHTGRGEPPGREKSEQTEN